jgi:hypothetical protein
MGKKVGELKVEESKEPALSDPSTIDFSTGK